MEFFSKIREGLSKAKAFFARGDYDEDDDKSVEENDDDLDNEDDDKSVEENDDDFDNEDDDKLVEENEDDFVIEDGEQSVEENEDDLDDEDDDKLVEENEDDFVIEDGEQSVEENYRTQVETAEQLFKTLMSAEETEGNDDSAKEKLEKLKNSIKSIKVDNAEKFLYLLQMLDKNVPSESKYDKLKGHKKSGYEAIWDKLKAILKENLIDEYEDDFFDDLADAMARNHNSFWSFQEMIEEIVKENEYSDNREQLVDSLTALEPKFPNKSGEFNLLSNISLQTLFDMKKADDEKTRAKREKGLNEGYKTSINLLDDFHEKHKSFDEFANFLTKPIDEMVNNKDFKSNRIVKANMEDLKKNIEKTIEMHRQPLTLYAPEKKDDVKEGKNEEGKENIIEILTGDGYSPMYIIELADFVQECDDYLQIAKLGIMAIKSKDQTDETKAAIDELQNLRQSLDAKGIRQMSLQFITGITDESGKRIFRKSDDDYRHGIYKKSGTYTSRQFYAAMKRTLDTVCCAYKLILANSEKISAIETLMDSNGGEKSAGDFLKEQGPEISTNAKKIIEQYNTLQKNLKSIDDTFNYFKPEKLKSLIELFKKAAQGEEDFDDDDVELLKEINDFTNYQGDSEIKKLFRQSFFRGEEIFKSGYDANGDLKNAAQKS